LIKSPIYLVKMTLIIRDMTEDDEYYVGTCTHENENNTEYEWSYPRRISWLRSMESKGLRVKVALLDEIHVGFLYLIPIEINPWSIKGDNLMVFPCLVAHSKFSNKGVGSELIKAAEEETIFLHRKGIVTIGYFWDFWFMPAKYFLKLGYEVAQSRGKEAILWKKFEKTANSPSFQDENYKFSLVEGKIVIDLFWNIFCQTSDVEAQRVREVVTEYGNNVILNEYSSVDQQSLQKYGINRRIYVNGKALEVGGEIEKNKLREAIESSLAKTI
jgi:predicted N-acetyltransferase YhbS/thiol-disulfide isomerase/thioredoxin